MPRDVILLGEIAAHLEMLEVRCGRRDRHGPLRVDRLLAEHGPDVPVGSVMPALVGDCPNRPGAGPVPPLPSWRSCSPRLDFL